MNNLDLIDELKNVADLLADGLPGSTSSTAILQAATRLMLIRRLDLILAEAINGGE